MHAAIIDAASARTISMPSPSAPFIVLRPAAADRFRNRLRYSPPFRSFRKGDAGGATSRHPGRRSFDLLDASLCYDIPIFDDLGMMKLLCFAERQRDDLGAGLLEARAHCRVVERVNHELIELLQDGLWRACRSKQ